MPSSTTITGMPAWRIWSRSRSELGIGRVPPGGGLKQNGGRARDHREHVMGRFQGSGDARITKLGELGGEGMIDGAVAIVDDENLLQRTHEHQC